MKLLVYYTATGAVSTQKHLLHAIG